MRLSLIAETASRLGNLFGRLFSEKPIGRNETERTDGPLKVLAVGPSWVGDMVMAQSLFKAIKSAADETEITVLAPKWSGPLLGRMPEVNAVIEMPVGHGSLRLGVRRKLARVVRHHRFDQAIILPGSFKSALIPWLADIPKRTGFIGEQRWGLINDIRRLDKSMMPLNVQRYVSLGRDRNRQSGGACPRPALDIDEKARKQALSRLKLNLDRPVLALCPGAEYGPAKQWPAKHFAEAARMKIKQKWQVWLFGSEKDRNIAELIDDLTGGKCKDLTGKTTLTEAVDLISCADHVITNDSGLMHLAAAAGVHLTALFGSTSEKFTPPLSEKAECINLNLSCSPCFKRECPLGHLDCLNKLTPELVLESIKQRE